MNIFPRLQLCLFIICCAYFISYAQPSSSTTTGIAMLQTTQPYEMQGDKFTSEIINGKRVSKLIGHAKLVLKNDKITIIAHEIWYYTEEKKLQAMKNVTIIKEDQVNGKITATANYTEYYEIEKKAILTGSPQLVQGESKVSGDKITAVFPESGAVIEIEGNVFGLLVPKETEPKKEEK